MSPLETLIQEILELDKKATPGPLGKKELLHSDDCSYLGEIILNENNDWVANTLDSDFEKDQQKMDADLIVHYRTSAPKLAKALQAAVAALEKYVKLEFKIAIMNGFSKGTVWVLPINEADIKGIFEEFKRVSTAIKTLAEIEKMLAEGSQEEK